MACERSRRNGNGDISLVGMGAQTQSRQIKATSSFEQLTLLVFLSPYEITKFLRKYEIRKLLETGSPQVDRLKAPRSPQVNIS